MSAEEAVRAAARAALEAAGAAADAEIDIAATALAFARIDLPREDPEPALAHLALLAEEARGLGAGGAEANARALARLLVGRHLYRGDEVSYDDPANANLLRVIARRRGLPVALGVVWLHAARAAGIDAFGLDVPGHFLLGLGERDGMVVVDVFDAGALRTREELAALLGRFAGEGASPAAALPRRMGTRQVLLRLQNNLRLRRAAAGDLAGAFVAASDMLRLAPEAAGLWREAALLAERLDRPRDALAAWERAAALTGEDEAVAAVARLRLRLN